MNLNGIWECLVLWMKQIAALRTLKRYNAAWWWWWLRKLWSCRPTTVVDWEIWKFLVHSSSSCNTFFSHFIASRDCLKVLKTADFPPQTSLTTGELGHTQNGSGVVSVHTAQRNKNTRNLKASRSHRLRAHRSAALQCECWKIETSVEICCSTQLFAFFPFLVFSSPLSLQKKSQTLPPPLKNSKLKQSACV